MFRVVLAEIVSPTRSSFHLGPIPVRFYALAIVVGIVVAVTLTTRRFRDRGGNPDHVWDVAGWAIVLGIIGARLYNVITDPELYFGSGKHPIDAFKVWDGGLGIWGAVALGAVGVWIGCRRRKIRFSSFADAAAPGIVLAQGIGRWGNFFNNELYGGHTSLPWGLKIHCMDLSTGKVVPFGIADGGEHCNAHGAVAGLFQPTFLYESIWDIALAIALLLLDRRFRMGRGNVFLLYVAGYTAGRGWVEALRTDPAHRFLGVRLNDWVALVVFLAAVIAFFRRGTFREQREPSVYLDGERWRPDDAANAEPGDAGPADDEPDDAGPGDAAEDAETRP